MPSQRLTFPSNPKISTSTEIPIITGTSKRINCLATTSGVTTAASPRITKILKILLPTMLPKARSVWPLKADITLTASSGALVPKATTVRPTTKGEIPTAVASRAEPLTKNSALTTRITRPRTNKRMVTSMSVAVKSSGAATA